MKKYGVVSVTVAFPIFSVYADQRSIFKSVTPATELLCMCSTVFRLYIISPIRVVFAP